ncbi:hypothetical protein INR49_018768 [Caranx melampygus]|nr:hypothetical protein INR49_018768 [Caranx melampygus]
MPRRVRNPFARRNTEQRKDGTTPLISENNNSVHDGFVQVDNPLTQNSFNTHKELAELLGVVTSDLPNTFEDGCFCMVQSESHSGLQTPSTGAFDLIQRSVSTHFPKLPAPLDQNLPKHLVQVRDMVLHQLVKLGPVLTPKGLMGCLIDCYHRQTFDHLDHLLQGTTSFKSTFALMFWVQHVYLSPELLDHPDLQEMKPVQKVDVLRIKEWEVKAKEKLLENVQTDVRRSLRIILQDDIKGPCDCEESYVKLYLDIIQCVTAMGQAAAEISSELSEQVQKLCFQELLVFLKRYVSEQTETLETKAQMDKPETIYFLKTLKTCKELKFFVQTTGFRQSPLNEMVVTLGKMEASTLSLLRNIITDLAESHLKKYFRSNNKLIIPYPALDKYFPKLPYGVDEQKRVMDEAYKLIDRTYIKHLVSRSQRKLKKSWSPDIAETVAEDAKLLKSTISDLAPGVQQRNLLLLKVVEILKCGDIESLKIEGAALQQHCLKMSEDMELLPTLLRWKGLSKWEVQRVLGALPPDLQPRPDPGRQPKWFRSCFCCFCCLRAS